MPDRDRSWAMEMVGRLGTSKFPRPPIKLHSIGTAPLAKMASANNSPLLRNSPLPIFKNI